MQRAYADTSMGQIHYRTAGEGPVILLLHASNHSSRTFTELLPLLAEDYRLIAPDYPGFGNSDLPPVDVSIPDLVKMAGELLDQVNVETATVFGLHTGNKIGAAMGARTPGRVDRLVLCGLPHSIIPDEAERDAVIEARVGKSMPSYPPTPDGTHHLKRWADLQRRVTDRWWNPSVIAAEGADADRIDLLARHVQEAIEMRDSLTAIYGANFEYDWTADLERIEAPTQILELADADERTRHGLQGERLLHLLPNASWRPIEDVDASVFYRSPETIADYVRDFLEE